MPSLFVNCDWGTTRLRMRAIAVQPWQLMSEYRSGDGTASISAHYQGAERPHAFATILAEGLVPLASQQGQQLAGAPILISGMASSSIGWRELPYASLPISLNGSELVWQELPPVASVVGEHRVLLISGVRSQSDIMRGEESELIGLFTLPEVAELAASSVVIKPGTHSKHLRIRDGALVDFQTYMTGELFAVLSKHSVLKHSVGEEPAGPHVPPASEDFLAGVEHARSRPLSSAMFQVRTRDVLANLPAEGNRDFLSGVLVGAELAGLASEAERSPIVLAATEPLATSYRAALEQMGLESRLTIVPPDDVELLSARGQALLLAKVLATKP
jgi:2-dehydro-3-deoxygalactonokinase